MDQEVPVASYVVDVSELTLGDIEKLMGGSSQLSFTEQLEIMDHCLVGMTSRSVKIKDAPKVMEQIREALEDMSNPTSQAQENASE
jgi:hypothetical protein